MAAADALILLEPEEAACRRDARARRENVRTVPLLRWIGLSIFVLLMPLHDLYLVNSFSLTRWLTFALCVQLYCLGSWLALRTWYQRAAAIDLGVVFLVLDVIVLGVGIYLSGAEGSRLYWVVLARVADQSATRFRRVMGFAALSVGTYAAVLLAARFIGGHTFPWLPQVARLMLLSGAAFYLALSSRAAERLRERITSAVRLSRDLIHQLEEKTAQLEENTRQLDDARVAAEDANRAKTVFMSRVSHELRTPMNHILGFAQLLEMDKLTAQQKQSVQQILKGGHHLLGMIDEVLDISSLEAGNLQLALEPVFPRDAVRAVLSMVQQEAAPRGIVISTHGFIETAPPVLADPARLRQVLLNVLTNAVRYNVDEGRVRITQEFPTDERVRISIEDTGPGIPADRISRLFVPFDRLGVEQTGIPGTGLGLPVSRALVHAMGGELGVTSEIGRGTTFWIELQAPEKWDPLR